MRVKARIAVFSNALDCSGAVVIRMEKREPDCGRCASLQLCLVGAVISVTLTSRIPRSIGDVTAGRDSHPSVPMQNPALSRAEGLLTSVLGIFKK